MEQVSSLRHVSLLKASQSINPVLTLLRPITIQQLVTTNDQWSKNGGQMSVFLKVAGAALMMLGIGLGLTIFTKPGMLDALGIRLDTAALLLIGGLLATGQSAIIGALRSRFTGSSAYVPDAVSAPVATIAATVPSGLVRKPDVTGVGAGATTAAVATAGIAAAASAGIATVAAKATSKDPVADTISALEQAKADVIKSIGGMDATTSAPATVADTAPVAETLVSDEATAEEPELDEDGLYVIEEKVVRGRPARILSDDTVEAETDEGWMRFENMEHLNEYLDSVEEQSA